MAIHKLTDLKIRAKLREIQELSFSPNPKNALLGDGQGLYLSVTKTGTASWLFRYMDFGKAKSVGCWRRFKIEPPCRLNFEPGLMGVPSFSVQ